MIHDDDGVLAVVIGRAGSKGLPGKNTRLVAGRPMICYTIEHATQAECVTRVVVSTDGPRTEHPTPDRRDLRFQAISDRHLVGRE